jgi:autotransporter-associated beta strand protein
MNAAGTVPPTREASRGLAANAPVARRRGQAAGSGLLRAVLGYFHQRAWRRLALVVAGLFATTLAPAATNVWSGAGGNNAWTNAGNWFGVYASSNINQFTNVTTTINFSVNTNTAGILLSGTASNVTVTNTARTMTLSGGYGLNIQTGALTLRPGTVTLGSAQTWTVANGAVLTVGANVNKAAYLLTITNDGAATNSGVISGTGGLTKSGAGTLSLGGVNTYSGNTIVSGGTLRVSGSINGGGTVTVADGATLDVERTNVTSGKDWSISGTVSAGSGFYQTLGNLTLNGGTLTGTGSGNSQYGFYTVSSNKSVTATGISQIIAPGKFTFQGTGSVTCNVVSASDTLTISSPITNATGTAGLTKTGSGLLTLNGTNTYAGATIINAGKLRRRHHHQRRRAGLGCRRVVGAGFERQSCSRRHLRRLRPGRFGHLHSGQRRHAGGQRHGHERGHFRRGHQRRRQRHDQPGGTADHLDL